MQTRTKLGQGGRLVIPVRYRKVLGLKIGDRVVVRLSEGEIRVFPARRALERAQAAVKKYTSKHRSFATELIEERRANAARD